MPHHFRTIEAFVQLLETYEAENRQCYLSQSSNRTREYNQALGRVQAYHAIAAILRTSNIGIVYPPPELDSMTCRRCLTPAGKHVDGCPGYEYPPEPNGTRCPDCGLPCDPATGEHVCSDGQVRGFRVSP